MVWTNTCGYIGVFSETFSKKSSRFNVQNLDRLENPKIPNTRTLSDRVLNRILARGFWPVWAVRDFRDSFPYFERSVTAKRTKSAIEPDQRMLCQRAQLKYKRKSRLKP
jgi:hypothetical protein